MTSSSSQSSKAIAAAAVAVLVLGGGAAFLLTRGGEDESGGTARQSAQEAGRSQSAKPQAADAAQVLTGPEEIAVAELRSLPREIEIESKAKTSTLREPNLKKGNLRLADVRELIAKDELGGFLAPRISPDGLQVMLTRAGYQGIYVMPIGGGEPALVAMEDAWNARWTEDGRIAVKNADGTERLYAADGTLEGVREAEDNQIAFGEDDQIYVRGEGGESVPLTGNDDRYINPVVSGDGSRVAYLGLYSGLYVAPADGSGEPLFLGTGTNPTFLADGSLVYDVTEDDGHHLTQGDIYHVSGDLTEVSNLTEGDDHVSQVPHVGPDGETLVYESDGSIYIGRIQ
ncbi:MAG: hypothetical protein RLY93_01925 [Sumerlaeia bacterium]